MSWQQTHVCNQVLTPDEKAFEKPVGKKPKRSTENLENLQAKKIQQLDSKLVDRNEMFAELMEENGKEK